MNTSRSTILFLASLGALSVFACSSSDSGGGGGSGSGGVSFGGTSATGGKGGSGTGGTSTGGTSTGGSSTGGSSTGGSSTGGASGSGGAAGADAGICKTPTTLHPPNPDAGTKNIYCPFSGADGGKNVYCNSGSEHCCEPKNGTSSCQPLATACGSTDTDWQCEDPSDCGSGMQCCGTGTLVQNPDPNCANFASGFKGTKCAASCGTGEIQMCTSDGECGTGKTCLPFATKGNDVGGCI